MKSEAAELPGLLFEEGEIGLRKTGVARLADVARAMLARRPGAEEIRRRDESSTMRRLLTIADELALRFGLRYTSIEPESVGVNEHYGICYDDGRIRIRLRHARTGRLLKDSSLVDTLCHEMAHLRHMNHGLRFRRLYRRILDEARRSGHYRPGPASPGAVPRQLRLFDDDDCGTPDTRTKRPV